LPVTPRARPAVAMTTQLSECGKVDGKMRFGAVWCGCRENIKKKSGHGGFRRPSDMNACMSKQCEHEKRCAAR
jgi:hypothetical protein